MKKIPTVFLQSLIVILGIATMVFMLWEPHLEGRNVNATTFEIYFKDPFLAYVYTSSILFFAGLYQAFKILGYVRENKIFSQVTVKALRTIRYCAITLIPLVFLTLVYAFIFIRGTDDTAGGTAIGLFIIFVCAVVTAVSKTFERIVQNVLDKKSVQIN